jgi:hypothetical protein
MLRSGFEVSVPSNTTGLFDLSFGGIPWAVPGVSKPGFIVSIENRYAEIRVFGRGPSLSAARF